MEDMAELVEEGLHFRVLEERRTVGSRLGEVGDDRCHRCLIGAVGQQTTRDEGEGSRVAELALAREKVHVEVGEEFTGVLLMNRVSDHIRVPGRCHHSPILDTEHLSC
jgi:hypothetical protein